MKKIILALAASAVLLAPATANASAKGAMRAVEREVEYDHGRMYFYYDSRCSQRGAGYYTCAFSGSEINRNCAGRGDCEDFTGRARVYQYGSRYSISYRLYW